MQEHKAIQNILPHTEIQGIYILGSASQHQARNGPFWKIELRDATGSVEAKIWSPLSQTFTELPAGNFVEIRGRSDLYREKVQITIENLRILSPEDSKMLDQSLYVPSSPYEVDQMWQDLETLCLNELTHKPWLDFVFSVFQDANIRFAWMACPAAKNIHHAYRGGLLEHSLSVAKLAMDVVRHYPELDKQALLVGAIFHDLGKIWEFSSELVTDYTTEGRLLGHMHLALEHLQPHLLASGLEEAYVQHFKHLILSHHGTYEFGSARLPHTPEAMLLHYIDNIDAKMAQCRHIFASFAPAEEGWSEYQRSLERYMYQPLRSPVHVKQTSAVPSHAANFENAPLTYGDDAASPNVTAMAGQTFSTAVELTEDASSDFAAVSEYVASVPTVPEDFAALTPPMEHDAYVSMPMDEDADFLSQDDIFNAHAETQKQELQDVVYEETLSDANAFAVARSTQGGEVTDNAISFDTAEPQETAFEAFASDAVSETPLHEAVLDASATQEAAPQEAMPQEAMSQDVVLQETASQEVILHEVMSHEAILDKPHMANLAILNGAGAVVPSAEAQRLEENLLAMPLVGDRSTNISHIQEAMPHTEEAQHVAESHVAELQIEEVQVEEPQVEEIQAAEFQSEELQTEELQTEELQKEELGIEELQVEELEIVEPQEEDVFVEKVQSVDESRLTAAFTEIPIEEPAEEPMEEPVEESAEVPMEAFTEEPQAADVLAEEPQAHADALLPVESTIEGAELVVQENMGATHAENDEAWEKVQGEGQQSQGLLNPTAPKKKESSKEHTTKSASKKKNEGQASLF